MNVNKVIPCGYCKGVINAINLAKKTKENYPNDNVYILGMIVHNKHVVKELEDLGIITLDTSIKTKEEYIESIDKGIIILTAHGTKDSLKKMIINKGLKLVDATCKDVLKTEEIIKEHTDKNIQVLYYGIKNHPESIAALSISNNVILIENIDDLDDIDIKDESVFISQTTMSKKETEKIFNKLKTINNKTKYIEGICNATDKRQDAIRNIENCDILYIIGDKSSNNTNKLKEIASQKIEKVYLIDNKDEININELNNKMNIYVSAGASTPPYLIDETISYLKSIF